MTAVLTLVLAATVLAFFGCFFIALCHDQQIARKNPGAVEIIRLAEKTPAETLSRQKSA